MGENMKISEGEQTPKRPKGGEGPTDRRRQNVDEPAYAELVGESAYSAKAAGQDDGGEAEARSGGAGSEDETTPADETAKRGNDDEGVSVPPEEMGRAFLEDATEARAVTETSSR